ncbi:MAG: bile acid:sodium symporter [Cruoricaptor ignavus]|nr:bile acid:sodium symporter [Cruoricaptor ignavus]
MKKIFNKQNVFLLLLVLMVLLGKWLPYREEYSNYFNLEKFIDWGIALIFLLYGLKLNLKSIVKDVSNWRLHLLVQFGTFILFPLLVYLFYGFAKNTDFYMLWLSAFFLASLPSTVSSSVVMVSIARGNVTSAIFNASISGLIGIVMTPLLMGFFLSSGSSDYSGNGEVVQQLLLKVLLPIVLGLLLNPLFKNIVSKYSHIISEFDRLVILLIVYESFSQAFLGNIFSSIPAMQFIILTLFVVMLFFVVYEVLRIISIKLKFNRADIITATFCGSKKSLVHGSLFVLVLGISAEDKVLFLLPVMIYHSFQLFYVSWLASRLSKQD